MIVSYFRTVKIKIYNQWKCQDLMTVQSPAVSAHLRFKYNTLMWNFIVVLCVIKHYYFTHYYNLGIFSHLYWNVIYNNVSVSKLAHLLISSAKFYKEQKRNFQLLIPRMLKLTMLECSSKKGLIRAPMHFKMLCSQVLNNL